MDSDQDRAEADDKAPDPRLFVSATERSMKVLEVFHAGSEQLSLADIAERTGLGRSAVQRIVYTLHHLGYLTRAQDSRFYGLSFRMLDLCRGLIGRESPARRLQPVLEELSDKTGETAAWVQRERDEIVVLQSVLSRHFSHVKLALGQRFAALSSSSGQVMLAYDDPSIALEILQRAARPVRDRLPFATPAEMAAHFAAIRAAGYAVTGKAEDQYSVSLSAPVFDASGTVIGAINLSALESRYPRETVGERLSALLLQAAREATRLINR